MDSYEESLTRAERRVNGVYYTPAEIVDDMLDTIGDVAGVAVCDPCCGCGNFLIGALLRGADPNKIWGFDIDAEAVRIARERIKEISGVDVSERVQVGDFHDFVASFEGAFDVIATNPPWGSNIGRRRRAMLMSRYGIETSDSAALMVMAALRSLREGGRMTALLPESFFNIGSFESVRRRVLELNITHLRDYERPFRGLMTRAQSVSIVNELKPSVAECRWGDEVFHREVASFGRNPKSIINMWLSQEGATRVDDMYARKHLSLAGWATWGMGIVTGDNARYCSANPKSGYREVVRGYNITEHGVEGIDTYIPSDMSGYQQVAPREFYESREKVVYRFISNTPIFCLETEGRYLLNSANGFILKEGFGLTHSEVVERLNSEEMRWLHGALFRSHKILRGDIEMLPLKCR